MKENDNNLYKLIKNSKILIQANTKRMFCALKLVSSEMVFDSTGS